MKLYALINVSYDYHRFESFRTCSRDKEKLIGIATSECNMPIYENPDGETLSNLEDEGLRHWEIITIED